MAAVTVIWSEHIFDSVGDKGIGTVRYCGFLAFIIEENAKFQLEVSEKVHIYFPHLNWFISWILNVDPLGGVVNANLRIFSKSRVQSSNLPNSLPITVLFTSLCSLHPTSGFPYEESKLLVTGPFLTLHPICRGFIASLMVEERGINLRVNSLLCWNLWSCLTIPMNA